VSKDVRIRGYFSKPKGVHGQKISGNTAPVKRVKQTCHFKSHKLVMSLFQKGREHFTHY